MNKLVGGDDLRLAAAGRWLLSGGEGVWTGVIRISGETGAVGPCSAATQQLVLTAAVPASLLSASTDHGVTSPPSTTPTRHQQIVRRCQVLSQLTTLAWERIFLNVNNCFYHPAACWICLIQTVTVRPHLTMKPPHRCFHSPQPDRLNNLQCRKTWWGTISDCQSSNIPGRAGCWLVNKPHRGSGRLWLIILPQSWSILQQCRDTKPSCPGPQLFP